jgi:hypothetical protein
MLSAAGHDRGQKKGFGPIGFEIADRISKEGKFLANAPTPAAALRCAKRSVPKCRTTFYNQGRNAPESVGTAFNKTGSRFRCSDSVRGRSLAPGRISRPRLKCVNES